VVISFCKNLKCGKPLSGKQRAYCSDKCRKAYKRQGQADGSRTNGHSNSTVLTANEHPANVFALFADNLSGLSLAGLGQVKLHLVTQAEYADVCLGRLTHCQHDISIKEKILAQQFLCSMLWRMVDDVQDVESAIRSN